MGVKEKLKQRVAELEEDLKKAKEANEGNKSGKSDDEVRKFLTSYITLVIENNCLLFLLIH